MRTRLFLSFTLIVLVSVGSMVVLASRGAASEVRAFMFRGGMAGIEQLAVSLENYYQTNQTWQGVEELFEMPHQNVGRGPGGRGMGAGMMQGMMNQRFQLANSDGEIVVDTNSVSPSGSLSPDDLERSIKLQVGEKIVGYLLPEGGISFTSADEAALLNRLNRAALTAGLVAGGLSIILASLLAYNLLHPIRALTQAASNLAHGDLSQRVKAKGNDEIASLGRAFNHMAASLDRAKSNRRAMTADIAHELRTPLAVQRAHLEALQDGIFPLNQENLAPILEQNQMLTRLVDDLRTLAMADSGQLSLEKSPTDFLALVRRVVEQFHLPARKQIQIQFSESERNDSLPEILIDPQRVEQIINNLLSNAVRHTPPEGRVDLKVYLTEDNLVLTVHDSGPGIPPETIPHVFERFYRADRSRSRAEGGSGLGLSIARQLAIAHGGDLTAANHHEGGALFKLMLPLES